MNYINGFFMSLKHYSYEVVPAVLIGFLISGVIYELIPTGWVNKYLGKKGIMPVLAATVVGAFLPICCWGSLPVAVSLYKKGAKLGPVLAFLVATPATSVSALLVTYQLFGLNFTIYIFFGVILMGVISGLVGNELKFVPRFVEKETCPHCSEETIVGEPHKHGRKPFEITTAVLKYAFWEMPKELGLEILIGLLLAAMVASVLPIGHLIKHYLSGGYGYLFSVIFGLAMYICSTASVPLVNAFTNQGLNIGAGMVLLLLGPITSYGTILVLRKEFGTKILFIYLALIVFLSLALGLTYSFLSM
ncbi:MAG: permease [Candidatus Omnitrophica bacterium]|nr:permease [Candidatus Omnitrophota bacterium]